MRKIWSLLGLVLLLPLHGDAQRHDIPQEDMGLHIATHYGAGTCTAATLNAAMAALGSTADLAGHSARAAQQRDAVYVDPERQRDLSRPPCGSAFRGA